MVFVLYVLLYHVISGGSFRTPMNAVDALVWLA